MKTRGGFSLIQVVLAMVVLLLIGSTLAPRFSSAGADARIAGLCENLQNVRRHIEVYRRQHEDRLPASVGESGEDFIRRITGVGENLMGESSWPRLERMPINPYNRLDTVRIGGAIAGAIAAACAGDVGNAWPGGVQNAATELCGNEVG